MFSIVQTGHATPSSGGLVNMYINFFELRRIVRLFTRTIYVLLTERLYGTIVSLTFLPNGINRVA